VPTFTVGFAISPNMSFTMSLPFVFPDLS